MTLRRRLGVALALALLADAAPAFAQPGAPPRTPGSLFGGETGRKVRQAVDFTASLVETNDSDTPTDLRGLTGTEVLGGRSTLFTGGAKYHWDGSVIQVGATGTTVLRHYDRLSDSTASHSAGLGASARLGPRTSLSVNQSIAYAPAFLYGLFPSTQTDAPGRAAGLGTDYAVDDAASYNYGTTVSLSHGLSRRSRVSAGGEYQLTDFVRDTQGRRDLKVGTLHGDFATNLARRVAVRAGYRYRTGTFAFGGGQALGTDDSSTEHGLELGLEYARPVSASRRMLFAFGFGPAILSIPVTSTAATTTTHERVFRYAGEGSVAWEFSRSWNTRVAARRSLEYNAQLLEPVFVNGLSVELGGVLTPRLDVQTALRYSNGASLLAGSALQLDTYSTETQVRVGLSRSLAVFAQHVYYFYDFQQSTQVPGGLPRSLERNGVRVGVSVWMSALRR